MISVCPAYLFTNLWLYGTALVIKVCHFFHTNLHVVLVFLCVNLQHIGVRSFKKRFRVITAIIIITVSWLHFWMFDLSHISVLVVVSFGCYVVSLWDTRRLDLICPNTGVPAISGGSNIMYKMHTTAICDASNTALWTGSSIMSHLSLASFIDSKCLVRRLIRILTCCSILCCFLSSNK